MTYCTSSKAGHVAASCPKGGNKNLYAVGEKENAMKKHLTITQGLQALCLLEDSDKEQWQEVTSRRDKPKIKKAAQTSKKTIEVKTVG